MPNEGNILFKKKSVRDFVENVAIAWKAKFPARAKAYKKLIKEDLDAQVNASGMTKGGNLRYTGAIPTDVFYVIERKIPGFFNSPEKLKIFQDMFMGNMRPMQTEQKFFFQGEKKK